MIACAVLSGAPSRVVSFAAIGVKAAVGKLTVPTSDNTSSTPASGSSGWRPTTGSTSLRHRDPFDRLLIARARCERLTVMTADARMPAYDVSTLDTSR